MRSTFPARFVALLTLAGCVAPSGPTPSTDAVLTARPSTPKITSAKGEVQFEVGGVHGVVYVPEAVNAGQPAGLVLFLHGALRTVDLFVDGHKSIADQTGVIVLAPYATQGTWDAIHGQFDRDPAVLNAALDWVFDRWTIDPARIAISGFSDGGTYALAIGRRNGNLFSRIAAYSPGFLIDVQREGKPPIMISHGTNDQVLPIAGTSRVIVPQLRALGYEVDYREFEGPHAVLKELVDALLRSLQQPPQGR